MVALRGNKPERAFLQDRIAAVPKCERKDQELIAIANGRQAILPPAIGFAPGLVMTEVVPGRAIRAVVLAHCSPGALADIRTPASPHRKQTDVVRMSASAPGEQCARTTARMARPG